MIINLPTNNFSFFKFFSGFLFLLSVVFFPLIATYSFIVALVVGRAHTLGAWLAMWRAGKLNWVYIFFVMLFCLVVPYWGLNMVSYVFLGFVTNFLFVIHFMFDEFLFHEESRESFIGSFFSSFNSTFVILFILLNNFYNIGLPVTFFVYLFLTFFMIELIFLKEINWFFINTKLITIFTLVLSFYNLKIGFIIGIFLVYHYFFWFVYPVYKLHKYKREERDGLVMILLIVLFMGMYFTFSGPSFGINNWGSVYAIKAFWIITIIHILTTAPFGYLFGLPRANKYLGK